MDLSIIGIRDAATEKERLLVKVENNCDLYGYIVLDNTFNDNGTLSSTNRHVFIFPPHQVAVGDIVRLYTKRGEPNSKEGNFGEKKVMYHNFYWNFDEGSTVWNESGDIPYIIHFDDSTSPRIV